MNNKLSKEESIEAIKNLELDEKAENALLEMLEKNFIEIHRNLGEPRSIEVKLTERGLEIFKDTGSF